MFSGKINIVFSLQNKIILNQVLGMENQPFFGCFREEMPLQGVVPDVVTFSSAIAACEKAGGTDSLCRGGERPGTWIMYKYIYILYTVKAPMCLVVIEY